MIATLNILDGFALDVRIDPEDLALFEQTPNAIVCSPLGRCSRILAITSYRHWSSLVHRRRTRRRPGKNAAIGHTVDACACHRHTIVKGFPSVAHPILT
jgi:hypothetical protein